MDGDRLLDGRFEPALLVVVAGVEASVLRVVDLVEDQGLRGGQVIEAQAAREGGHGRDGQERVDPPPSRGVAPGAFAMDRPVVGLETAFLGDGGTDRVRPAGPRLRTVHVHEARG
jgi:hypothetical protein